MRLLIIEDDRDAADYLVKAFREVGHIADQATDGEEGQAMALDGQYDVLIVDRMLPKRDGLSIIHTLRSKSIEPAVTIIWPNPTRFPNCWLVSRRWHDGPASAARRPSIASAISSSTGYRTKS